MLTRQLLKWLLLDSIYFVVYNIVFLNRASRESTAFQRHTHRQNLQSYILHRLDPFFSATFTIFSFQLNSLCVRGANWKVSGVRDKITNISSQHHRLRSAHSWKLLSYKILFASNAQLLGTFWKWFAKEIFVAASANLHISYQLRHWTVLALAQHFAFKVQCSMAVKRYTEWVDWLNEYLVSAL